MGGILGGGSSINFMMYTRAQGIDFDSWETEGWTAEDMLPLCKKLETFHQDEEGIDPSKHGYDGPIHVSDGGYRGKSELQFIETVKKIGHNEVVDLQDLDQNEGFSVGVLLPFMKLFTNYSYRDGSDMSPRMEKGRMLPIVLYIHYCKTVSIQTYIFWLTQRLFVCSLITQVPLEPSESSTNQTKNTSPRYH